MAQECGIWHVTIFRGTAWNFVVTLYDRATGLPLDLTGCEARIQAFDDDWDGSQIIDLASDDVPSTITMGGAAGTITPVFNSTASAALTLGRGKWFLDIKWAGGDWQRIVRGNLYRSDDTPS